MLVYLHEMLGHHCGFQTGWLFPMSSLLHPCTPPSSSQSRRSYCVLRTQTALPGFSLCSGLQDPHVSRKKPWAISTSLSHLTMFLYWTLQPKDWTAFLKCFITNCINWTHDPVMYILSEILHMYFWQLFCYANLAMLLWDSWYCPLIAKIVYYYLDYKFNLLGQLQLQPWSYR